MTGGSPPNRDRLSDRTRRRSGRPGYLSENGVSDEAGAEGAFCVNFFQLAQVLALGGEAAEPPPSPSDRLRPTPRASNELL